MVSVYLLKQSLAASVAALQSMPASDALDHAAAKPLRAADAAFAGLADTRRAATATAASGTPAHAERAHLAAPRAIARDIAEFEQALPDAEKTGLAALAVGAVCGGAARAEANLAKGRRGNKAQHQQSENHGAQGTHIKPQSQVVTRPCRLSAGGVRSMAFIRIGPAASSLT
jgi:hypothetical protein